MIPIHSNSRCYFYSKSTDMRKSFDGLSALVSSQMDGDLLSGDVFIFINKSRNYMKLLVFDRNGFWLCAKRLEKGCFHSLELEDPCISYDELLMFIEGINFSKIKRKRRYKTCYIR